MYFCHVLVELIKSRAAGSFYYSLLSSKLLNRDIKRVKYVLTYYWNVLDGVVQER